MPVVLRPNTTAPAPLRADHLQACSRINTPYASEYRTSKCASSSGSVPIPEPQTCIPAWAPPSNIPQQAPPRSTLPICRAHHSFGFDEALRAKLARDTGQGKHTAACRPNAAPPSMRMIDHGTHGCDQWRGNGQRNIQRNAWCLDPREARAACVAADAEALCPLFDTGTTDIMSPRASS